MESTIQKASDENIESNKDSLWNVYLRPRSGELGLAQIEMKKRVLCIDLSGRSSIEIVGLNLHACSARLRSAKNCKLQSMQAFYISHFTHFSQTEVGNFNGDQFADFSGGNFGIYLSGENNRIQKCEIGYSAGSGILVYGNNQTISNNYIHHINYTGTYHAPIFVDASRDILIEKNQIRIFGRSGIHCAGANSGFPLKIRYNHIHHGGYFTGEKGAIYTYGPSFNEPSDQVAEVSYNWIHDMWGWSSGAIVLDGGGRAKWRIHHNVIWHGSPQSDRDECNICWAKGYNLVYNNTYLDSAKEFGNWEPKSGINELYLWRKPDNYWKLSGNPTSPLRSKSKLEESSESQLRIMFTLTNSSPAVDAGSSQLPDGKGENNTDMEIQGNNLTDYIGKAPDLGAYELGAEIWKAGADWQTEAWRHFDLSADEPELSIWGKSTTSDSKIKWNNQGLLLNIIPGSKIIVQIRNLNGKLYYKKQIYISNVNTSLSWKDLSLSRGIWLYQILWSDTFEKSSSPRTDNFEKTGRSSVGVIRYIQ